MKLKLISFFIILLFGTDIYAATPPEKKPVPQKTKEYTEVVYGHAQKLEYTANGTYVTCVGTHGKCMLVDYDNGVALVDPDNCGVGPTYVGLVAVQGLYYDLIEHTQTYDKYKLNTPPTPQ
jgi:hypothetical protein